MMTLLKLGLFALSLAGWCCFVAHRFGLRIELAPFVAFSGLGAGLYLAGLLNIYSPVEWAVYLGGLGLLAFFALWRRCALAPWRCARTGLLAAAAAWMLWLMRGGVLYGHDNMSHWGIMAKTMIRFGRLPNTQNTAVEFVSYPPGTASFIKYFCDFVGTSDGLMMYAQGLLLLAGAFTLLAFCKKGQRRGLALWAAAAAFLLVGNITPADLRVDTLLAVQGVGALAVIAYYGPQNPRKAAFAGIGGLVLLAVVKSSGLFFVAADLVALTWFLLRQKQARRRNAPLALVAWAAPMGAFWLWLRHVALIFPTAENSKHAVSLGGYENIFAGKTAQEMQTYNQLFLRHLVDFTQPDTRCMYLLLGAVLGAALWLWRSGALPGRRAALLGAALGAGQGAYLVCLWCTYAFSMNASEMLCLASFSRYHLTGILYLAGGLAIAALWGLGRLEGKPPALAGTAFALVLAALVAASTPGQVAALYSRAPYRNTETQGEMLELKARYGLEEGKRYLFYTRGDSELDTWSMRFVARYVLNTDTVDFWQFSDQEYGLDDLYGHYDYLVLYAPDGDSRAFLQASGFDPDAPYVVFIQ